MKGGAARWVSASAIGAMVAAFVAFASTLPDPTLARGAYAVGDRRAHRLASLTFAAANAQIAELRAQRDAAADPTQKALLSVRLADVFARRQMFAEARGALAEARALAPGEAAIALREALIDHAMGDAAAAQAALDDAEHLAPGDPEVEHARAFIAEDRPPASDRWGE